MALLTSYGAENRVVDTGKNVIYQAEKQFGEWTYLDGVIHWVTYGEMWKLTRTCTKQYKYVGMDKTTAQNCADYLTNYYTRPTWVSEWQMDSGRWRETSGGRIPMAEVTMQNVNDSKMYDVVVNVNEYDEKWSLSCDSISSYFTHENGRAYDT